MSDVCRLLIIDDDATIREMLELMLGSEGYTVVSAPHGAAALALLDEIKPHIILLDMKMPVMDGWEFLEQYRRRPGRQAPVVVLTAAQDDKRLAADLGADAYLAKPFAIDDLLRLLERCMSSDQCVRSC
jgi:CheY-like chemotaxis protein